MKKIGDKFIGSILTQAEEIPGSTHASEQVGIENLKVGGHYLRFDGAMVRRIDAIAGDEVCWRDEAGTGTSDRETFARLSPMLAPAGTVMPPLALEDDECTIRDETNALTAFALRNGFIENLHAGKRSPLLDGPGNSRITDDEMHRLMIEASETLARMLRLKCNNPKRHSSEIRAYRERCCTN